MFEPKIEYFRSLGLICAISWLTTSPSLAQNLANNQAAWSSNAQKPQGADIQSLKDIPELPQLPGYSGKPKFLRGYTQSTSKGWTAHQIIFLAKEEAPEVKDWYDNALSMYQWRILRSSINTITANHKDGHMCTLVFNPTSQPGYRTQISVFYSLAPSPVSTQD